ncbi:MAG: zf-HC2 domain-containing protein [Anaerolineales bacterium]|nr:zf-HC2 domain-containing protein [Anaerolineales bacterium]
MSDHILELLGAYLDGELRSKQLHKVEVHLAECLVCQEEYAALQALSATLQKASLPDFSSPERLATDVALRLPRRPSVPTHNNILNIGWWLVPVGLIITWIFISTTFLASDLVTAANDFGLLNSASDWLVSNSTSEANYSTFLGQFGFLEPGTLQWFTISESFARNFISNFFWQVSIAMLYLSWIAIWWARHTRQGLGQPLES